MIRMIGVVFSMMQSKMCILGVLQFSLFLAVIQMTNLKVDGQQLVKSFDGWLSFVKGLLPKGKRLPSSYYDAW